MKADDGGRPGRGDLPDERSLADLMARHDPRLRRVAERALAGEEGPETADDVLQEAFLRARTRLGDVRGVGEASVVAWLARLVWRLALDARRRHGRQRRLEERLAHAGALAAGDDPLDRVAAALADRQVLAAVAPALARLPAGQRRALELRARLTIPEVAAALGCTPGAVRTRLARARAACREAGRPGAARPGPG